MKKKKKRRRDAAPKFKIGAKHRFTFYDNVLTLIRDIAYKEMEHAMDVDE
jgi:hypothetical protein